MAQSPLNGATQPVEIKEEGRSSSEEKGQSLTMDRQ